MKKCPYCEKGIQNDAVKCRHCKKWVGIEADKECPFCNSLVNKNDVACQNCNRPLLETTHSSKSNRHTYSEYKESFKKHNRGLLLNNIRDVLRKFRFLGFLLGIALLCTIYYYISTSPYERSIDQITNIISQNVKSVAKYEGTDTDSNGTKYNHYLYANKDLNINLFKIEIEDLEKNYNAFLSSSFVGKKRGDNFLRKYKTIYLYTIGEVIERAYIDDDYLTLESNKKAIEKLSEDETFKGYIEKNSQEQNFKEYMNTLDILMGNIEALGKINDLEDNIKYCNRNCSVAEYNSLVRKYNSLLDTYKENKDISEKFFQDTMKLVEVSLIFPTQNKLDMTNGIQGNKFGPYK